jgi:hypothetical protein
VASSLWKVGVLKTQCALSSKNFALTTTIGFMSRAARSKEFPACFLQNRGGTGRGHSRGMGLDPSEVQAVPAPEVNQTGTYASAVALRRLVERPRNRGDKVNVVSMGAHSRRTRFLFQKRSASRLVWDHRQLRFADRHALLVEAPARASVA